MKIEYNSNGKPSVQYISGAKIDEIIAKKDASGRKYYYIRDGLNSVRMVVDAKGNIVQKFEYTPFGEIKTKVDDLNTTFAFTGREYDTETGLYFYRARQYDANIGRFLSEDPIGILGGMNLYAYCENSPTNYTDPLGLLAAQWHFGITFVAAVLSGESVSDSVNAAIDATAVDFAEGSQGNSPEAVVQHAMATEGQSYDQAVAAAQAYIQLCIATGNLAGATHAAQDLATPGHAGQSWTGFAPDLATVMHIMGDMFPSSSTVLRALLNTMYVLNKNKSECSK